MRTGSNSQNDSLSLRTRLAFLADLLRAHLRRLLKPVSFDELGDTIVAYRTIASQYCGRPLEQLRSLEIGYGQRPHRMIALASLGCDVVGIDLDRPLYRLRLGTVLQILRGNGALRCAKTVVRRILFDRSDYRSLAAMLRRRFGCSMARLDERQLLVGDAAAAATWEKVRGTVDFIYSDDVFEHIPPTSLADVLRHMAAHLTDGGVAVVTPMIFTGICGGHRIRTTTARAAPDPASSEIAWGHLTGEMPPADTYLNRLTRAEYRSLFGAVFDIVEETVDVPDLGRAHLTEERRQRLAAFDEEELFSNRVRFVLRKRLA